MKYFIVVAMVVFLSPPLFAEPDYNPPEVGAPVTRRVGGGARGIGDAIPTITVIAPLTIGYTLQPSPTLFWAIEKPVKYQIEISMFSPDKEQPLFEKRFNIDRAGVHSFSLQNEGIVLKKNQSYEWFIALIKNPKNRNEDVLTSGLIKYVDKSDNLQQCLSNFSQMYVAYAKCGVWYDAIMKLSEEIAKNPSDDALKTLRKSIFRQEELPPFSAEE
ncbi:MAG: hypothetical protein RIT27_971 [Pseudomonadota bacterium]|jgi:hypothetical protein